MANLLCDLLVTSGMRGGAESCKVAYEFGTHAGMSRSEVETIAQDCVKDLIMQSYDSDKAHTVFTSNVSSFHSVFGNFLTNGSVQVSHAWLDEMIQHATWRDMIYKLSEEHKKCVLLGYAIKVFVWFFVSARSRIIHVLAGSTSPMQGFRMRLPMSPLWPTNWTSSAAC